MILTFKYKGVDDTMLLEFLELCHKKGYTLEEVIAIVKQISKNIDQEVQE